MENLKLIQRTILELRQANRFYLRWIKQNDLKIEKLREETK